MKLLRNVGSKKSSTNGVNKRLFQGYTVGLTALVMAWMIHNLRPEMNHNRAQLFQRINQSLDDENSPFVLSQKERKDLLACLKKFWVVFLENKCIKRRDISSYKLEATTDLRITVHKLIDSNVLGDDFQVPLEISENLFDISGYPTTRSDIRSHIEMELLYQLCKRKGIKGVSRKIISQAMGLNSHKDNHKVKVRDFLKKIYGEKYEKN